MVGGVPAIAVAYLTEWSSDTGDGGRMVVAYTAQFGAPGPDDALYQARSEADRDLAPYRRNMTAPQIEQLQRQYIHKRLLEQYRVPRLSLFYM